MPRWQRRAYELRRCLNDGEKFLAYSIDHKFCCQECRWQYYGRKRQKAVRALELMEDHQRVELLKRVPQKDIEEFIESQPKTRLELTPGQINRMNKLTDSEFTQAYSSEPIVPIQIEPRPTFEDHQTWPEQWQCTECNRYWPMSVLHCTCSQPEPEKPDL